MSTKDKSILKFDSKEGVIQKLNKDEICSILGITKSYLKDIIKANILEERLNKKGYNLIQQEKQGRNVYYIVELINGKKNMFNNLSEEIFHTKKVDILKKYLEERLNSVMKTKKELSEELNISISIIDKWDKILLEYKFVDNIPKREINVNIENFKVPRDKWNNIGVYIIIDKDNSCYIGSTTVGFRNRFLGHYREGNKMQYTYDLLHKNNAEFKILEDMTGKSEEEIRERENYYIQLYNNDEKYNLINHMLYVAGVKPQKGMRIIKIKVDECEYESTLEKLKGLNLID